MKTGAQLIAEERQEQIEKHGYSLEHDSQHENDELTDASVAIILSDADYYPCHWDYRFLRHIMDKSRKDQLIVAGALIAAEIDRLIAQE